MLSDKPTVKVDPHFYRSLAHSYFVSAKALWERFGEDENIRGSIKVIINPTSQDQSRDDLLLLPHPFHYLLSHSLELYMKGYLMYKNMPIKEFKKLGHKLKDLMEQCEKKGFVFIKEEKNHIIDILDELNREGYILRYPAVGTIKIPNFLGISILIKKFDERLLTLYKNVT